MIAPRWRLVVSVLLVATTLPAAAQAPATRGHVQTLASEKFAGREAGSAGERLAADYIASQLARIGARPLPGRTDMFVPFTFSAGSRDGWLARRRRVNDVQHDEGRDRALLLRRC